MRKILLFILLCPAMAFGQISEGDTMRFQSRFSTTANWQTGNVELLAIRSRWDMTVAIAPKVVFKTQNAFLYQEFFRTKVDQDIFSRNFLYFNPQKRFYSLAISHFITNYRRKIDFRYFVGLGVSWQAVRTSKNLVKFSMSAIYEETKFANTIYNESSYNGSNKISTWRATLWAFGRHSLLNKKLIAHYEAYVQPSLEFASNYRWQTEIGFDVPLYKGLSFTTNFIYTYENVVIQTNKKFDSIFTVGFSHQFKK
jgi:hypothetical protein